MNFNLKYKHQITTLMYITSIIWYLAWPVLIAGSTLIILYAVKKFDSEQTNSSKS